MEDGTLWGQYHSGKSQWKTGESENGKAGQLDNGRDRRWETGKRRWEMGDGQRERRTTGETDNGRDGQRERRTTGETDNGGDGQWETGDGRRETRDGRREMGDGRRETGDGRRETGDGRRETGDGRRETGDGRRETGELGDNTTVQNTRIRELENSKTRQRERQECRKKSVGEIWEQYRFKDQENHKITKSQINYFNIPIKPAQIFKFYFKIYSDYWDAAKAREPQKSVKHSF
ncbi:hypothetical protein EDD22DRAFT_947206 [Suillus occidentalis]|nr:hypothetical protein EDD22DRAFT_947206 [Suillus occidentalis]